MHPAYFDTFKYHVLDRGDKQGHDTRLLPRLGGTPLPYRFVPEDYSSAEYLYFGVLPLSVEAASNTSVEEFFGKGDRGKNMGIAAYLIGSDAVKGYDNFESNFDDPINEGDLVVEPLYFASREDALAFREWLTLHVAHTKPQTWSDILANILATNFENFAFGAMVKR
jgi:hypothetical protein